MTLGQELLNGIFRISETACVVTDLNFAILAANDSFIRHFDVPGDCRGKKLEEFIGCLYEKIEGGISIPISEAAQNTDNNIFFCCPCRENQNNCLEVSIKSAEDCGDKFYIFMFIPTQQNIKTGNNKYKELFDNLTQGFALHEVILDDGGKVVDYRFLKVNKAFELITGKTEAEITGKSVKEVLPMTEPYWLERYGKVALTGMPCSFEEYSSALDKYFSISAFCPKYGQFAVVFYDVSEIKKMQKALSESEQRFKRYIDNAPDAVFISDLSGKYTEVNKSACRITGFSREEIIGNDLSLFLPESYSRENYDLYSRLSEGNSVSVELPFVKKDRDFRYWSIDGIKLSGTEIISFHKDITEKKLMQEKLQYNYFHDQLTGLYNRRYINQHRSRYEREEFMPAAVVVGDINGLKVINSAFGHSFGDKIIIAMAEIVTSVMRPEYTAAKWGGDEFILIMPRANIKEANEIMSAIKSKCLKTPVRDIYLSISLGFGIMDENSSFEDSVKAAEDMMEKNKIYESESFRSQTINMILKTLHEKNPREEQHSVRVSRICVALGKAMKMSEYEMNRLRVIGLMHDIGKIGIDEKILNKEGKLTEEEYAEIKKHPEIGYRILSSNNETSEIAHHILTHHERYDGNGYPGGIKGEKVSIISRILTIADSFDAMTSQRPYRRALSRQEAAEEIMRHAGKQFDPVLADVFVNKVLASDSFEASV